MKPVVDLDSNFTSFMRFISIYYGLNFNGISWHCPCSPTIEQNYKLSLLYCSHLSLLRTKILLELN